MNPLNYILYADSCHLPVCHPVGRMSTCALFSTDVAFYSKCQQMCDDKEAPLILPMLQIIMWKWLKHSVAAYRKPAQPSETSFRAGNSSMIARTMCHKGCETPGLSEGEIDSQLFTKQLRKLETALSLTCVSLPL